MGCPNAGDAYKHCGTSPCTLLMKWRTKIIWKEISHGAFSVSWPGADRHLASAALPKTQPWKVLKQRQWRQTFRHVAWSRRHTVLRVNLDIAETGSSRHVDGEAASKDSGSIAGSKLRLYRMAQGRYRPETSRPRGRG